MSIQAKIYKILFVFFSDNFIYQNKSTLLSELKKKKSFKESNETILPLPDNIPPEIPIMLLSKSNEYEIRFSRNRIDYISVNNFETQKILLSVDEIFNALNQRLKNVGLVISLYFDDIPEDQINTKIARFFNADNKDIFNMENSSEFVLRNLYKKQLEIGEIKTEVNFSTTFTFANIEDKKRISVDFDINTFPSRNIEIDNTFVKHFIEKSFSEKEDFINKIKKVFV